MGIKLWENNIPFITPGADNPNTMQTYFIDTDTPLPCVVVLPGGGYRNRARHEGAPIAEFFNGQGFHAVVVDYRVAPNRFPAGLSDVQRAIKILRCRSDEWRIAPDRIVICGFSAGGHLAASSILYADMTPDGVKDETDSANCIPNGAILGYPVISLNSDFGHEGSGKNLLGEENYDKEKTEHYLPAKVTQKTPPVFMWHTSDDPVVNVKNSLTFATALRDHNIPFEMHIFPHGPHGTGLAEDHPDAKQWKILAAEWIKRNV